MNVVPKVGTDALVCPPIVPYSLLSKLLSLRTDEGVCPYYEAFISINEGTSSNSKCKIHNSKL
ncbi:hypothetical protein HMPREF0973_01346 [Prevotella veroralis F0319]|uniref:Uncharacterized protein n=1 Tax=Prevotella veroralis F0319 TaxID=649761 RepID=C9MP08_9BACT|nr:hypothetical protein HMPREF0973_01346 [Prevotella veroralis F0319]